MTYENRCWRSSAIMMRSIPCSPKTGYNFPHLSDISVRSAVLMSTYQMVSKPVASIL